VHSEVGPIDTTQHPDRRLSVYLLGTIGTDEMLRWQRRLVYDVSGEPESSGVLVLCEHPPQLSLGRTACRTQIALSEDQLTARALPLDWVARGGGLWRFAPGQVVGYSILSLSALELSPAAYVAKLSRMLHRVVADLVPAVEIDERKPGLTIRGRRVAQIGVAVRHGIASFGFVLNVRPDLELWRNLACEGDLRPVTSLQRECRAIVRPGAVRQRLIEVYAEVFGFAELSPFQHHPAVPRIIHRHASFASRSE